MSRKINTGTECLSLSILLITTTVSLFISAYYIFFIFIMNKQSRTADKGWHPTWVLGKVLTIAYHTLQCYQTCHKTSDLD